MAVSSRIAINNVLPGLYAAGFAFMLVFAAALAGILSRPEGHLAVLWPANAILLAAMVRVPGMNGVLGWIAAFAGFVAADMITGSSINKAVWLTVANMAGVVVGVFVIRGLSEDDRKLGRPISVLYLCLVSLASAIGTGVIGSVASFELFRADPASAFLFWACTEFTNYMVILPFVLSVRGWSARAEIVRSIRRKLILDVPTLRRVAPFMSLLFSLVLVDAIGGPGAMVFPVPALLWCALTYRLPVVAFLAALMSHWLMVVLELDLLQQDLSNDDLQYSVMSIRLGVALLSLGPLTVVSIDRARLALMAQLDHAANHDFLTGLLARGALMRMGSDLIAKQRTQKSYLTLFVMDLDYFKEINDTHGHAVGDQVLVELSKVIQRNLRATDLFARLGGEEFCLLLPDVMAEDGEKLAARIKNAVAQTDIVTPAGKTVRTTVSIGMITRRMDGPVALDTLINEADKAMYRAKQAGRNRVMVSPERSSLSA